MRTTQVSIHAKLFGTKQLSKEFVEKHGNVLDVHAYVDSNSFPEALMAAVTDISAKVEEARGYSFGSRRDFVSSAMEGEDARLARQLEPSRPIDIKDLRAITEIIERESSNDTVDTIVKQTRLEQSVRSEIDHVRTYLDSRDYADTTSEEKDRFAAAILRQGQMLQQLVNRVL